MRQKSKILIVDDNPTNERILRAILSPYELNSARSGVEALEQARRFEPDLVLLDVMMPEMDGYEACRRMRMDPKLRLTKIVMVSAKAMVEERIEGYGAGADDYVTKPFDPDELKAKVRVHLRLKTAEELDEMKSDFIGLMCHETRTPLAHVLTPAEVLAGEEDMSAEDRRMWADLLLRGARRIHRMHEKILLLSSLKGGSLRFERGPADLAQVARDAVFGMEPSAAERAVRFELNLVEEAPIWGDAERLGIAVTALLENAVRFSPPEGVIEVSVGSDAEWVFLRVADSGPGIAADHLPRLFDEFSCPDVSHHGSGVGLSLAIARRIVRAHGGELTAAARPEGGSTFEVSLPCVTADALEAAETCPT